MGLIKTFYKGKIELTMSEFQNLASIDENTDYNIMDYPDNGMTNAQLVETLNYTRLFKVGHITICLDDGAFLRGHIIQLQYIDGVRVWTDITATASLDIDSLSKLGGLSLGAIVPMSVVTNDPYLQPLDGRSLSQSGIYSEFCTWLKNRVLANSNNVPTCTIAEYANEMVTYGQCGKFVINDTATPLTSGNFTVPANSIKLPTITEFIASNNGGDAIGLAELDEFKSHNHYIPDYADAGADTNPKAIRVNTGNNTKTGYYSVYTGSTGGSETRPKNVRYPYYIVVAIGTKTNVEINLNNVANDIATMNSILEKTYKADIIYDMKGGVLFDWGISTGLGDNYSKTIDLRKFDMLMCTYVYDSYVATFMIDLTKEGKTKGMGIGGIAYDNHGTNLGFFTGEVNVSADRQTLSVKIFNAFQGGYSDSYGYISKIVGFSKQ